MSNASTSTRQRLTRDHKAAVAALEHAHDCSLELRQLIAQLPKEERETAAVQLILQAVDKSDLVYEQTPAYPV